MAKKALKTIEIDGEEYTVDPAALDDYILFERISRVVKKNDAFELPDILESVLGAEQLERAKEALKDEHGRVAIESIMKFFQQVLMEASPN